MSLIFLLIPALFVEMQFSMSINNVMIAILNQEMAVLHARLSQDLLALITGVLLSFITNLQKLHQTELFHYLKLNQNSLVQS